jgi:hypothetical protein
VSLFYRGDIVDIQVTRVVNLHKEEYDVRIDRKTMWGNPFPINKFAKPAQERNRVCDLHDEDFWHDHSRWSELHTLIGKRLGCHCAPKRCHGDFLAREANLLYLYSQKEMGTVSIQELFTQRHKRIKLYGMIMGETVPRVTPGIISSVTWHHSGRYYIVSLQSLADENVVFELPSAWVTGWLPL